MQATATFYNVYVQEEKISRCMQHLQASFFKLI